MCIYTFRSGREKEEGGASVARILIHQTFQFCRCPRISSSSSKITLLIYRLAGPLRVHQRGESIRVREKLGRGGGAEETQSRPGEKNTNLNGTERRKYVVASVAYQDEWLCCQCTIYRSATFSTPQRLTSSLPSSDPSVRPERRDRNRSNRIYLSPRCKGREERGRGECNGVLLPKRVTRGKIKFFPTRLFSLHSFSLFLSVFVTCICICIYTHTQRLYTII